MNLEKKLQRFRGIIKKKKTSNTVKGLHFK